MAELIRDVVVRVKPGLTTGVARDLNNRIREYDCELTIEGEGGMVADARSLFGLLILGIKEGDRVTVRSSGPDAGAAVDEVVLIFEGPGSG